MGKGGLYGKRKKQNRPKSFKEERESEGGKKSTTSDAITRYGTYTVNQGYDKALNTTQRRKYERKRGKK